MRTHLRIVLPGGNGQVGNILARHFHAQGHDVVVLAGSHLARWRVVTSSAKNPSGAYMFGLPFPPAYRSARI